jgi:hypothetical protein
VLALATALAVAVATPARAQQTASAAPAAISSTAEAPPTSSPLAGAQGAGWLTAPAPTLVAPPPVAPRAAQVSLAHRWWFWASLGVAAVAVVIAGFALAPGQPYSGNANPGLVPLP